MTECEAYGSMVRKFASDVMRGSELRTLKLNRFVDSEGYDFLKFNFPVCGNLSSADLMVIYCAMEGFDTYVVGNAERGRRDRVIRGALGLDNIFSVPELDIPVEHGAAAMSMGMLSFTNTQERGFSAIPGLGGRELVLEVAADQPLMYDFYRHAIELSRRDDVDFAVNLNAVSLMKGLVPSFSRNGYDKVVNSLGREVVVKENNNFAQDLVSVRHNRPVFRFIYENRNGGSYFAPQHLLRSMGVGPALGRLGRLLVECCRVGGDDAGAFLGELEDYARERGGLGRAIPYSVLVGVFSILFSPDVFRRRVHVDATNDDIFSCWDMDGLNNDFLSYRSLFRRNFSGLGRILPFSEEVYRVDAALEDAGKTGGVMACSVFDTRYRSFVNGLIWRLRNPDYLCSLGLDGDAVDMVRDVAGSGLEESLVAGELSDYSAVERLEGHLAFHCLPRYANDCGVYDRFRRVA
ncbi:hypothetical protein JW898_01305 [Candidatus Woesearchaeota archaeon]|nr:hypothetical protein [Candidatus Woesearchaeota archaeon]